MMEGTVFLPRDPFAAKKTHTCSHPEANERLLAELSHAFDALFMRAVGGAEKEKSPSPRGSVGLGG